VWLDLDGRVLDYYRASGARFTPGPRLFAQKYCSPACRIRANNRLIAERRQVLD
jgi:hypothetical protein